MRRLLIGSFLVVGGALSVVYVRGGGVSRATYNRICIGMNEEQVDDILAQDADELAPLGYEDIFVVEDAKVIAQSPFPHHLKSWSNGRRRIDVIFDANQTVVSKYYQRPPSGWLPLETIRWIGL